MKNTIKKLLSILLVAVMCFTFTPLYSANADLAENIASTPMLLESDSHTIAIGDTITLGTYNGEKISWICVDIDSNGPLMLSEKILCFKSFDAKGSHGNYYRNKEGTNNWKNSCLRHWLNSSGIIDWLGRPATPNTANVFNGYNPYSTETGFLSSFTAEELSIIKTVKQKTYINGLDTAYKDGGDREYTPAKGAFSTSLNNVNSSGYMYQNTEDKVFLLDLEQTKKVYNNLGADYLNATATEGAIQNDTSKKTKVGENYHYWLRVPDTIGMSYETVLTVSNNNQIFHMSAFSVRDATSYYSVGVRPAFYIDIEAFAHQQNNGCFVGILEETDWTIFLDPEPNTDDQNAFVSSITVDGKKFNCKLPMDVSNDKGETVVINVVDGTVTEYYKLSDIKNDSLHISVWGTTLSHQNGKYKDGNNKTINFLNPLKATLCLQNYISSLSDNDTVYDELIDGGYADAYVDSVKITISGSQAITFEDGQTELIVPVAQNIKLSDFMTQKEIDLEINKKYKFDADAESEKVIFTCTPYDSNGNALRAPQQSYIRIINNNISIPTISSPSTSAQNKAQQAQKIASAISECLAGTQGGVQLMRQNLIGLDSNLARILSEDQIKIVEAILLLEIAIKGSLSEFDSNSLGEHIDKKKAELCEDIIEDIFNTDIDIEFSFAPNSITVPLAIKTEKFGTLTIEFTCNYSTLIGFDSPSVWSNPNLSAVSYKITQGKKIKELEEAGIALEDNSCGFINIANPLSFADTIKEWAIEQLSDVNEDVYKATAKNIAKATDLLFGKGVMSLLATDTISAAVGLHMGAKGSTKIMSNTIKVLTVKCPVDVFVYNENDVLVASVENNAVTKTDELAEIEVNGSQKTVTLYNDNYYIVYQSAAPGTMDITVTEYCCTDTVLSRTVFTDIPLAQDLSYTQDVDNLFLAESDYSLTANDGNVITPDTIEIGLHDHVSDEEWYEGGTLSCTTNEWRYSQCSVCNNWMIEISAVTPGHKPEIINQKDATETENGYTGDTVCSVCGELLSAGEIIPQPPAPETPDTPADDDNSCSCICHSENSIVQFFYVIFRFLWQLFGMNMDCACGVKHFDFYIFA